MHDDGYFDEDVAATYDNDPAIFAPEAVDPAVSFLSELAGKGQALEFAIGTGQSHFRWRARALRSTASRCRKPWSRGFVRKRAGQISA